MKTTIKLTFSETAQLALTQLISQGKIKTTKDSVNVVWRYNIDSPEKSFIEIVVEENGENFEEQCYV